MSDEGEGQLDLSLLGRSAAGDREAFARFVRRHQAPVFRFCRTLAGRIEDAEDALQETFLTAWRQAGSFRGEGSARSWLLTIARRSVYRAGRRPRPLALGDSASLEELGPAAGWGRSDAAAGGSLAPDDAILLRQAFGRLAPADRQVLVLRDLEGFSNAEAAEILGVEVGAVKSRLHRARLALMAEARSKSHAG